MSRPPVPPRPALSDLSPEDRRRVGPFQVHGRIGAGGMGVVYGATGPDGGWAALKVVRAEYAEDAEFRARFGREIRLMERVRARSIAPLVAAGADDPEPWYATAYVPGPTLAQRVSRGGAMPLGQARALAVGMAEAIAGIHAAGIVHRDLKPANVILAPDGPKVVDFGIARALDETGITRTGGLIGSPGWMSPERFRGVSGPEDDVFAWGALVAYASAGRPPYGRGSAEALMYRVLNEEPDLSGVPGELVDPVRLALARDPADRPAAERLLRQVAWGGGGGTDRGEDDATIVATVVAREWAPRPAGGPPAPAAAGGAPPQAPPPAAPRGTAPPGGVAPPPGPGSGPGPGPAAPGRPGLRRGLKIGAAAAALLVGGALAIAGAPLLIDAASADREGGPGGGVPAALQELREQGYAEIAIGNEPPFGYIDEQGETTGYHAELARVVFAELGVEEVRAESVAWDALLSGLNSGKYDAVAAGMYITPERCEDVVFAAPDMANLEGVLAADEESGKLADYASVAEEGRRIGVLNASASQEYAAEAGIDGEDIVPFGSMAEARTALESGRVDAIGGGAASLRWMAEEDLSGYRVAGGFLPEGQAEPPVSGFAFAERDRELVEEVDRVLAEMRADGRLLEIVEPFGYTEEDLAPEGMTAEEACRG
ncbi:transporter substrate-binding domain-containing protein [Nocardiopsis sp. CNT-189]|uniref:serine/threonine-protein kinase n=1 Tax=Nocardiopsis oceanisediminis TaxID=2816862 RepID=UPI003B353A0C